MIHHSRFANRERLDLDQRWSAWIQADPGVNRSTLFYQRKIVRFDAGTRVARRGASTGCPPPIPPRAAAAPRILLDWRFLAMRRTPWTVPLLSALVLAGGIPLACAPK